MKKTIVMFAIVASLASCSSNQKKVLMYFKGAATVDEATNTVTIKEGSTNDEKTFYINKSGAVNLTVKQGNATTTVALQDNGYYVLNAKLTDTLIGSYQSYSAPGKAQREITQEVLRKGIDSLNLLLEGKNVTAANRNFFLLPNAVAKISENNEAVVVGPFHQMTSLEKQGDKVPEVYRFYGIKEIREKVQKLIPLTIAETK